jgi:cell wall-associated NlpC family hydrolase
VPTASADQISNLKAQAAAVQSRLDSLGRQEAALSERYDQAQTEVAGLQAKVTQASQQLAAAQATAAKARAALKADALSAYVNGGSSPLTSGANPVQNADNGLLRAEYVNTLATNQSDAIDQYHLAALQEQAAEANFKQQEGAAQAQLHQLDADRSAVQNAAAQLSSTENSINGQIKTLIAQQQAAQAAAAAAAAHARLVAQQQAAQAAAAAAAQTQQPSSGSSSGSGGAPANVVVYKPVPVGKGASGAVAAAESRVGDPYVWGASGPNTFDCSGLVMWAYEQVGISLPHYSGAQYADTTHISMSQLEPGDLVFPSDPGEHVAMYVGGGMIVEAPYTGATVHIIPLSSWFVLASRVA